MIVLFGSLELRVVCGCICYSLDAFGGPCVLLVVLLYISSSLCAFGGPRVHFQFLCRSTKTQVNPSSALKRPKTPPK